MIVTTIVYAVMGTIFFGNLGWLGTAPATPTTDAASITEIINQITSAKDRDVAEIIHFRRTSLGYSIAPGGSAVELQMWHRNFAMQHICAPFTVSALGPLKPAEALGWRLVSINGNTVSGELSEEAAVEACFKNAEFDAHFIGGMTTVRFERIASPTTLPNRQ